jgi:hypothetical protein
MSKDGLKQTHTLKQRQSKQNQGGLANNINSERSINNNNNDVVTKKIFMFLPGIKYRMHSPYPVTILKSIIIIVTIIIMIIVEINIKLLAFKIK